MFLHSSPPSQFSSVYVVNGIGGRFDQTLANMNTIYSKSSIMEESIYLLSEDSLCFVLEPVNMQS
jgi:thiamine pyrophosphokinase